MTLRKILAAMLTAAVLASGASMAHAATSTPTVSGAKAPVVRSAKSIACSAQADAKNLHGKERKAFRKTCMKAA